jgi:hypothetical protein
MTPASSFRDAVLAGFCGAVGMVPVLPIGRTIAAWIAGAPQLPGAERVSGDIKAATYAEAALLVIALPLAAFFFGHIVPRFLESLTGRGSAGPGIAFAMSFLLFRFGLAAKISLTLGFIAALLTTLILLLPPATARLRALRSPANRKDLLRLFAVGALLWLACAAVLGPRLPEFLRRPAGSLAPALLLTICGALLVSLRREPRP